MLRDILHYTVLSARLTCIARYGDETARLVYGTAEYVNHTFASVRSVCPGCWAFWSVDVTPCGMESGYVYGEFHHVFPKRTCGNGCKDLFKLLVIQIRMRTP